MQIWKLTPLDLTDANWEASSHRDVSIVRAHDEESARAIAAKAFDVVTRFPPGRGVRTPPWKRASLVRVEQIDDPRYDRHGPPSVLEPPL
jgi:hypothetical protein